MIGPILTGALWIAGGAVAYVAWCIFIGKCIAVGGAVTEEEIQRADEHSEGGAL